MGAPAPRRRRRRTRAGRRRRGGVAWQHGVGLAELDVPAAGPGHVARGRAPAPDRRRCVRAATAARSRRSSAGSGAFAATAAALASTPGSERCSLSTAARWSCSTPTATPASRSRCTPPGWSSPRAHQAGWTSTEGPSSGCATLGYEGGSIDELDAGGLAALEPALDMATGLRRTARAGRPLRAPGAADVRAGGAPAGRWSRNPRGLRASHACAHDGRLGVGDHVRRRGGPTGRRRGRPAHRSSAPPPRRACTAHGCAWLQRHDHGPRYAATPCAVPRRGEAGPEPIRRRGACRRRIRARREHRATSHLP